MRTAHAKGVPITRIVIRHLLRNASIPVVTVAALEIANLLAGAVIVETVFAAGSRTIDRTGNRRAGFHACSRGCSAGRGHRNCTQSCCRCALQYHRPAHSDGRSGMTSLTSSSGTFAKWSKKLPLTVSPFLAILVLLLLIAILRPCLLPWIQTSRTSGSPQGAGF